MRIFIFLCTITLIPTSQLLAQKAGPGGDLEIRHQPVNVLPDPPGGDGPVINDALERNIYIIPGTGGNAALALGPAERLIAPLAPVGMRWQRIQETEGFNYDDLSGIEPGSQELQPLIPNRAAQIAVNVNPDQTFLIGASYGGLVARQLLADYPAAQRPFGGIVTLATPNAGTIAADNRAAVLDATLDFVVRVNRGPVEEWIEDKFFLSWFNSQNHYSSVATAVQNLVQLAFPIIDNGAVLGNVIIPPQLVGISDMAPNATALLALPQTDQNFPSIHIICEENRDDLVWRFMNSLPLDLDWQLQGASFQIDNFNNLPDFTANTDDPFLTDMINNEAHYLNRANVWRQRRMSAPIYGSWYGGRHYSHREMENLRDAWSTGWGAIREFDDVYKNVCGFQNDTWGWVQTGAHCQCDPNGSPWTHPTSDPNSCSGSHCKDGVYVPGTQQWEILERQYFPNDGIVTTASQAAYGRARVEQPGDNHFQKSNSDAHRIAIERILDGIVDP